MGMREIKLKESYESGIDDLIKDFYIPVLKKSISYDRITGFFSSSSLAIAARGIAGLAKNKGKMRLIVSPKLSMDDVNAIMRANENPKDIIEKAMIKEIEDIEDDFQRDHVNALSWMIAKGLLQIKIAYVYNDLGKPLTANEIENSGLFHQKIGILKDLEGDVITFSGSINETARGWLSNIEEFKVFKFWELGQNPYCASDITKFETIWNDKRKGMKILSLPDAVTKKLIEFAPDNLNDLLTIKKYKNYNRVSKIASQLNLFIYQQQALLMWLENSKKLLFEMATGTGKTRAALGCIEAAKKSANKLMVFIACPQNTLSFQWKNDIELVKIYYDDCLIADSSNRIWKEELEEKLINISIEMYKVVFVFVTHRTFCSSTFIRIISKYKRETKYFLIGDEVHGLGAKTARKGLIDIYDFRLGLSATPRRWYDDVGTSIIYNFFGEKTYEFSIKQALQTINPLTNKPYLASYYYYPKFASLSNDELEGYAKLTNKIKKLNKLSNKDDEYRNYLDYLKFERANIHKNCKEKYKAFAEILDEMSNIEDLIIFVSPEQLNTVMVQLGERGIIAHKFTEEENTKPCKDYGGLSERQYIINKFKEGKYKALVAIKCLDEGIDIPSAKNAIILASSTNPREYIQRIGRVIRQCKGKSYAYIYDVIVVPDYTKLDNSLVDFEKMIFEKEMVRIVEIAENAMNNAAACAIVYDVLRR